MLNGCAHTRSEGDTDRNYLLSPSLGKLVSDEANSESLRRLAFPFMLSLRDKYGETVNLGVRTVDKITYLEVVPSEFARRLQESRGASVPMHASALGKAILAFSPQRLVEDLLRGRKLEMVTQNTISDSAEFRAEIKRVRAKTRLIGSLLKATAELSKRLADAIGG